MEEEGHIPGLLGETIDGLDIKEDFTVIDATLDGGGMQEQFLKN